MFIVYTTFIPVCQVNNEQIGGVRIGERIFRQMKRQDEAQACRDVAKEIYSGIKEQ